MTTALPKAALMAAGVLIAVAASRTEDPQPFTVHEWGTFTSIAGPDGRAVPWRPLGGPPDLPGFVRHADVGEKGRLTATVRMETPVLYFYATHELNVDVTVGFRQGLVTEYYPRAWVGFVRPGARRVTTSAPTHTIAWRNVRVTPGPLPEFPSEDTPNHYYAARETDASPLAVGPDRERFLFYRGAGTFVLPLSATVTSAGVDVVNAGVDEIPAVVLFEHRDSRMGWQVRGRVSGAAGMTLPPRQGNLSDLRQELERLLVGEGLYQSEAAAMVETWSDSWFEEGTRLFYLLPQRVVDAILPLEIRPAPAEIVRVFVGRLELVTPDTLTELTEALRANDRARLERFGRFLRPFADRLFAAPLSSEDRVSFLSVLEAVEGGDASPTAPR